MNQKIFLDFGVLHEGENTDQYIKLLESAIHEKKIVKFEYKNVDNHATNRMIEPIAVTYKWYAWYLFGYCLEKRDYRLFKLVRVRNIFKTEELCSVLHDPVQSLLSRYEAQDKREYMDIKLLCRAQIKLQVQEYLKGEIITEQENGDFIMALHLPENERMWFSIILGFGDQVEVLEPDLLKEHIIKKAKEILNSFNEL